MIIETTVNISQKNREILYKSSEQTKLSKNDLIKKLIIKFLNHNLENYADQKRIQYQKRNNREIWKSVHIWLTPELYDKCQDLRRIHKLSISHIVAIAIKKYLKEILSGQYDNYLRTYMFISFIHYNCPIFIITWDYPGNKMTQKLLNLYDNYT